MLLHIGPQKDAFNIAKFFIIHTPFLSASNSSFYFPIFSQKKYFLLLYNKHNYLQPTIHIDTIIRSEFYSKTFIEFIIFVVNPVRDLIFTDPVIVDPFNIFVKTISINIFINISFILLYTWLLLLLFCNCGPCFSNSSVVHKLGCGLNCRTNSLWSLSSDWWLSLLSSPSTMGKCFEPSSSSSSPSSPSGTSSSYPSRIKKIMKPAMEEELDFTVTASSSPDLRISDTNQISLPIGKIFNNNNSNTLDREVDDIATLKARLIQSTTTINKTIISDKANCYDNTKDLSSAHVRKSLDDGLLITISTPKKPEGVPNTNGTDPTITSTSSPCCCAAADEFGASASSVTTTTISGIPSHAIPSLSSNCTNSTEDDGHFQRTKPACSSLNKTSSCSTDSSVLSFQDNLDHGSRQKNFNSSFDEPATADLGLSSIDLNSDDDSSSSGHVVGKRVAVNSQKECVRVPNCDPKSHGYDLQQPTQTSHPQTQWALDSAGTDGPTLKATPRIKGDASSQKEKEKHFKPNSVNSRSLELPLTNGLTQMVESNFASERAAAAGLNVGSHNGNNLATPGTSCATTPSMSPIDDVTVMVGKNGKLSTVLENIPLLYIPTTKQLVSKDWPRVVNIGNSTQQDFKYAPMTRKFPTEDECLGNSNKQYSEVDPGFTCLPRVDASSLSSISGRDYSELESGLSSSAALHRVDASSLSSLSGGRDYTEVRTDASIRHQVDGSSLSSLSTGTDPACGGSVESDDYSVGASAACSSSSVVNYGGDEHHQQPTTSCSSGGKSKTSTGNNLLSDSLESSLVEVNLFSRNSFEQPVAKRSLSASSSSSSSSTSQEKKVEHFTSGDFTKRKSHGITGFLGNSPHNTSLASIQPQQSQVKLPTQKNLFRRSKETSTKQASESAPGWKLFGRIPPKESTQKDPNQISDEYHAKQKASQLVAARARKDIEVMSTTALILENRPGNLPSKAPEEERKHKQEYEAMVEAAKKKEQKDIRQKKKYLQQQLKHEEQLMAAARTWNSEVLPNWEVTKQTKRARDLWWNGLPPSVRGRVWKLAIGNELNITSELYEICLNRAKDRIKLLSEESHGFAENSADPPSNKEASVELIKLDVSRTFPQFCIFQKGGPYHDLLHSLLGAYACYRPDVGYVQGMSFLAAVLLLNMDVADAFICFANLLNGPCQVAFFRVDEGMMKSYFDTYDEFFLENMPQLHRHFEKQCLTPDIYIIDWIFTIFSRSLPLDVACRVWDVFCRDGEEFLFRTALGILHLYERLLLDMDFIHLAQFLTKLPEDISSDQLFRNIQVIRLSIDKKKFAQVLAGHREARERSDYF